MSTSLENDIATCERKAVALRRRLEQMVSGTFDFGGRQVDAAACLHEERIRLTELEQHIEDLKAERGKSAALAAGNTASGSMS